MDWFIVTKVTGGGGGGEHIRYVPRWAGQGNGSYSRGKNNYGTPEVEENDRKKRHEAGIIKYLVSFIVALLWKDERGDDKESLRNDNDWTAWKIKITGTRH